MINDSQNVILTKAMTENDIKVQQEPNLTQTMDMAVNTDRELTNNDNNNDNNSKNNTTTTTTTFRYLDDDDNGGGGGGGGNMTNFLGNNSTIGLDNLNVLNVPPGRFKTKTGKLLVIGDSDHGATLIQRVMNA